MTYYQTIRTVDEVMGLLLKQKKKKYKELSVKERQEIYREAERIVRQENRQGFWKTRIREY